MLIKEYRVINNCTQDEYQVAQLYATAQATKDQSKTGVEGEGVEILVNEPFDHSKEGEKEILEGYPKGQYTHKVFRLASKIPAFVRAIAPAGSMDMYEEAWNAYPRCRTVLKNGWLKDNFSIVYETLHVDKSRGEIDNALNISDADLKKREVISIDVANDKIDQKHYKESEDPKLFHSEKTGRGPLTDAQWTKKCEPVMTCYKLVYIEFKWFGLQGRVESFIASTVHDLFIRFHRQLFCWTDEWYGMTMEEIRALEAKTKDELSQKPENGTNESKTEEKPI